MDISDLSVEQIVNQKLLAQTLGVIGLYITGGSRSTKLHGDLLLQCWKLLHFLFCLYRENAALPDVYIVQRFDHFEKSYFPLHEKLWAKICRNWANT